MTTVRDTVPEGLQAEAAAALAFFNRDADARFEVTGILDPDASLAETDARTLRLVLCGGDRCEQRTFRVSNGAEGYDVSLVDTTPAAEGPGPAELDPPPGARRAWLDGVLSRHRFAVLVFYRGYW